MSRSSPSTDRDLNTEFSMPLAPRPAVMEGRTMTSTNRVRGLAWPGHDRDCRCTTSRSEPAESPAAEEGESEESGEKERKRDTIRVYV